MSDIAVKKFLASEFYSLKFKIFVFSLMSILTGVLEVVGIGLIFPFIYILISPKAMEQFKLLSYFTKLLHLKNAHQLNMVLLAMITVLIVFKAGYTLFFRYLQMNMLTYYKTKLSDRLMRMYLFSDYTLHMEKTTSEIMKHIALAPLVYDQYIMSYFNIFISVIMCLGLCGLLFVVLPLNAMIALVVIGIAIYGLNKVMKQRFVLLGEETTDLYQQRQQVMAQSLGAIRDTKILGRENYFVNAYKKIQHASYLNQHRYNFLSSLPPVIMEAWIMSSIMVVILFYIYFDAYAQALATFGVLLAVMFRMLPQVNKILVSLQLINSSKKILHDIADELYVHEKDAFIPTDEMATKKLEFKRRIEFNHVSYTYPKSDIPASSNLDVVINQHEFIGLTGPSGGGKTTFLNLFLGLVDPVEGQVLVDGRILNDKLTKRLWQNNIGYVPQGLYITEDTILNNIAFGIAADKIDIARALEAAESALLGDFIRAQPKGIHTLVGETGSTLSGGQRQRIGIARALYHDSEILVFDEATNGLDVTLENQFIQSMHHLKGKRTILMITHKLNTLKLCDRILVFNQSRLIDNGSFSELKDRCDLFRGLLKDSELQPDQSLEPLIPAVDTMA